MFLYKIEVNDQLYFGIDSRPSRYNTRWKSHLTEATGTRSTTKLHTAMREAGIENCNYSIVTDNVADLHSLARLEIESIAKYDTFYNGLNSTMGGDGLGKHSIIDTSAEDIAQIKEALSQSLSMYNHSVKWANTTKSERQNMTSHLHTDKVYKKKASTLKQYYADNPAEKKKRFSGIDKWRKHNKDKLREQNRKASLLGAAKTSKKVKVQFDDGTIVVYNSKSEYSREHGFDIKTVIKKTTEGGTHNGKKAWEI